jgi:hypothetical protein
MRKILACYCSTKYNKFENSKQIFRNYDKNTDFDGTSEFNSLVSKMTNNEIPFQKTGGLTSVEHDLQSTSVSTIVLGV